VFLPHPERRHKGRLDEGRIRGGVGYGRKEDWMSREKGSEGVR